MEYELFYAEKQHLKSLPFTNIVYRQPFNSSDVTYVTVCNICNCDIISLYCFNSLNLNVEVTTKTIYSMSGSVE